MNARRIAMTKIAWTTTTPLETRACAIQKTGFASVSMEVGSTSPDLFWSRLIKFKHFYRKERGRHLSPNLRGQSKCCLQTWLFKTRIRRSSWNRMLLQHGSLQFRKEIWIQSCFGNTGFDHNADRQLLQRSSALFQLNKTCLYLPDFQLAIFY